MQEFILNGKFLSDGMQGIVRYSIEIMVALDRIIDNDIIVKLVVPEATINLPSLKNIIVCKYGKNTGIKWEQTDFRRYLKKYKNGICINLCNVAPFGVRPGMTVIHDIMYKVNPSHYTTIRNKVSRLWHCLQYSYLTAHERVIGTVSEFSKMEIENNYPKSRGKVVVIPDAWQHVLNYGENLNWEEKYSFLRSGSYYFSLATLSKNKNGKWIIENAKKNPDAVFAIAGRYYETEYDQIPDNVHMLGFVSDEDACALIKHCKAFIFPSLYEGFGIPPLEALALGAKVISSNTTSLPEVLGESVHYIDPYDWNVELNSLLDEKVEDKNFVLAKYSWTKSATILFDEMKKMSASNSN